MALYKRNVLKIEGRLSREIEGSVSVELAVRVTPSPTSKTRFPSPLTEMALPGVRAKSRA